MKVERKVKPDFDPIVITLETEEEASIIWHRLNNNGDIKRYHDVRKIYEDSYMVTKLWSALNKIFIPRKELR